MFFDDLIRYSTALIAAVPFSGATWFILFILGFFVRLFYIGNKDPKSPVQWEQLIIDSSNNRASPYKLGYLIGLIVGTWIVVTLTDKNLMNVAIFSTYLTYLLGGAGANMYAKRGLTSLPTDVDTPGDSTVPDSSGDNTAPQPPHDDDHDQSEPPKSFWQKVLFYLKKLVRKYLPS